MPCNYQNLRGMNRKMKKRQDSLYQLISTYADILIKSGGKDKLEAHLKEIEIGNIEGTKTTLRFHSVRLNADGTPRINELCNFLSVLLVDYAIPREKIIEAKKVDNKNNNTLEIMKLSKEARALFVDLKNSGEGGEILLYALTEYFLKIPQLITKMSLKTSGKMHFHGVDGIYFKIDNSNVCLYFGESKMQKRIYDATNECFSSIEKFLSTRGSSTSSNTRDLDLIRDNLNLECTNTQQALLGYLDQDNIANINLELRGACFIGFDAEEYPSGPGEVLESDFQKVLKKKLKSWTKTIERSITKNTPVDRYVIELFAIPFPSVESFKERFLREMGIL